MPTLIYSNESRGCGATIKLDSGEIIIVSLARSGVLIRLQKGFLGSFFGPKLFEKKAIYKVAATAIKLFHDHPQVAGPLSELRNPNLSAYANTVWNCATAAQVAVVVGEAARRVASDGVNDDPTP